MKRSQEFSLTLPQVLNMLERQCGRCYYSGVLLEYKQIHADWRLSIERLNNAYGYTVENCVLIAIEFNTPDHSRNIAVTEVFGTAQWSREKVEHVWGDNGWATKVFGSTAVQTLDAAGKCTGGCNQPGKRREVADRQKFSAGPVLQETRAKPKATEAEIRVRAVGLNFRDVLNVMGHSGARSLRVEPSSWVDLGSIAYHPEVSILEILDRLEQTVQAAELSIFAVGPGDDVFGESPGCLRRYNCGPAALLSPKPSSWSFEEALGACCMPVIFVTVEEAEPWELKRAALFALGDLAQLKRGEHCLIHAAAGGVGLVAIQYAQHDMKNFLKDTDGLDVVLNSLSHDDYIGRSLALLKPGGRFMEIGKRGHTEGPDVMYEKIAADTMMDPWWEGMRVQGWQIRVKMRVQV
eukprot:Skav203412  [mRNA]  locus=scaffold1743:246905:256066:- [translate_table: standard]